MIQKEDILNFQEEQLILAQKRTDLAFERTALSNERTFLAWIRTSLACIGGGIAIVRFMDFRMEIHRIIAEVAGIILILIGIIFLILSLKNYKQVSLRFEKFNKSDINHVLTASVIFLVAIAVALLLII